MLGKFIKFVFASTFISALFNAVFKPKKPTINQEEESFQDNTSQNSSAKQSLEFMPSDQEPEDINNNFSSTDETIQSPG